MKQVKQITLAAIAAITLMVGCKKDDSSSSNSNFSNTPEAKVENDNKSGGIYKGALQGSIGYFKITLQGGTLSALLSIDNVTKTLNADSIPTGWVSGQPLQNAKFSKDGWVMYFSVDSAGNNPSVNFSVSGHPNISYIIFKENSSQVVKCYTGTGNGPCSVCPGGKETGDMSIITINNKAQIIFSGMPNYNSTLNGTNISGQVDVYKFTGTLNDNSGSGSITSTISSGTGNWSVNRVL